MAVSSQTANDLMTVFSGTITAGFSSLAGPVNGIFGLMIGLVVALTGLQWAVSSNRDVLAGAFSKILVIGAFAYIINDWQGLSETIFAGFMQIGLTAGGGSISAADFLNPGAVIETGWEIVKAIGDAPTVTENPLDVIGNLVDAILIGVSMLGIMIAFSVLALQIIVTLLEFKIVTLGGFILLPFGIFSKTSFMAERPLGYVVAAGLKVLALAIVVSGAQTIFAQLMPSPEPDIYEALTILTAAIILAMLSLFAPNLAAALVSGGPTLGAGALSVGGLAVGAAGGAVIAGTMAAGAAGAGAASQIATSARAAAGAAAGKPPGPGPGLVQVVARTHLERRHHVHRRQLRHRQDDLRPKHQLLALVHQELTGVQVFSPKFHPLGVRIQVKKRLVPMMALRLTPKGVKTYHSVLMELLKLLRKNLLHLKAR